MMHLVFLIGRKLFIVKSVCGGIDENTPGSKSYQGLHTLANIGDETRTTFAAVSVLLMTSAIPISQKELNWCEDRVINLFNSLQRLWSCHRAAVSSKVLCSSLVARVAPVHTDVAGDRRRRSALANKVRFSEVHTICCLSSLAKSYFIPHTIHQTPTSAANVCQMH